MCVQGERVGCSFYSDAMMFDHLCGRSEAGERDDWRRRREWGENVMVMLKNLTDDMIFDLYAPLCASTHTFTHTDL